MSFSIRLLPVVLVLAACGWMQPSAPTTIDSARAAWAAQEMTDYRFDFERNCFCIPEAVEPVTIEVRDRAIVAVRSRETGEPMPMSEMVPWYTVEELLRQIDRAEADGQHVRVEYHAMGYPSRTEIGNLADDSGVIYTISRLERIR